MSDDPRWLLRQLEARLVMLRRAVLEATRIPPASKRIRIRVPRPTKWRQGL